MADLQLYKAKALKNILWLGLLVGTLDGLAALLLNYNASPGLIFRFIASSIFGPDAYKGGAEMIVAGVVFHYLIAYLFTTAFYLLYPFAFSILKNKYVVANIYGATAWLIMNMLVVPLSKIGIHAIKPLDAIVGLFALIICVGLPIAVVADKRLKST